MRLYSDGKRILRAKGGDLEIITTFPDGLLAAVKRVPEMAGVVLQG